MLIRFVGMYIFRLVHIVMEVNEDEGVLGSQPLFDVSSVQVYILKSIRSLLFDSSFSILVKIRK